MSRTSERSDWRLSLILAVHLVKRSCCPLSSTLSMLRNAKRRLARWSRRYGTLLYVIESEVMGIVKGVAESCEWKRRREDDPLSGGPRFGMSATSDQAIAIPQQSFISSQSGQHSTGLDASTPLYTKRTSIITRTACIMRQASFMNEVNVD